MELISQLGELEFLSATGRNLGDAGNTTLKSLDLDFNKIGDIGATELAEGIKVNNSLQSLDLHFNKISPAGAKAIQEALLVNKCLLTLSLHGNHIGDAGARSIAESLQSNTTLQTLSLGKNGIGNDGATILAESLRANSGLQELHLEDNRISDSGATAFVRNLRGNSTLRELWLINNLVTGAALAAFANLLDENYTLTKLGLTINSTDTSAETKAALKRLKKHHYLRGAIRFLMNGGTYLNMDGFQLGDQGGVQLADAITQCDSLLELHLSNCAIGDRGACQLAKAIASNTTLTTLSLSGNAITEEGIQQLTEAQARAGNNLENMDLRGNPGTDKTTGVSGEINKSPRGDSAHPIHRFGIHTTGGMITISIGEALIPDLDMQMQPPVFHPSETLDGGSPLKVSPPDDTDKPEEEEIGDSQEPTPTVLPKLSIGEDAKEESSDDDGDGEPCDLSFLNNTAVQNTINSVRSQH